MRVEPEESVGPGDLRAVRHRRHRRPRHDRGPAARSRRGLPEKPRRHERRLAAGRLIPARSACLTVLAVDLRKTALSSERPTLKAFTPDDAAEGFAAVTPALTRFMGFEASPSLEAFAGVWQGWLPQMAAGAELILVVRLRSTGEFLGVTGLHGIGSPEPETGIWINE